MTAQDEIEDYGQGAQTSQDRSRDRSPRPTREPIQPAKKSKETGNKRLRFDGDEDSENDQDQEPPAKSPAKRPRTSKGKRSRTVETTTRIL